MLVAVPAFLRSGWAGAGPVQVLLQGRADPGGEQPADLAAHRRVERGPHDPGNVGGTGTAQHTHPAGGQR